MVLAAERTAAGARRALAAIRCGYLLPLLLQAALAETAIVLGRLRFEARRGLRGLLGADRGALGIRLRGEAQLELLGEIHDGAELTLDELGVAAQAAPHAVAELAQCLKLFLAQAFGAQARAERQEVAARFGELLARLLDGLGVLPPVAEPRIPDAAAPVVPVAAVAAVVAAEPVGPEVVGDVRVQRILRVEVAAARTALLVLRLLLAAA